MSETIVDAAAGRVACAHRRVAIVGTGPGRHVAPWSDDSFCWWALNEIPQPRADRHFELHPMSVQNVEELAWLGACPVPCYVLDLGASSQFGQVVKNAVQYPLDRLLAAGYRNYFTCTFAYQISLALLDGFREIALYGVQLHLGSARERVWERACVDYWIGVAEGRGVRVVEDSGLAHHVRDLRYGYDYHAEKSAVEGTLDALAEVLDFYGHRPRAAR